MQEEVTEKTVVLSVRTAKMTARVLQSVLRKLLASMKKVHACSKIHKGRQTVKQHHAKIFATVLPFDAGGRFSIEASAVRAAAQFIVRSKGIGGIATNKQKVGFR